MKSRGPLYVPLRRMLVLMGISTAVLLGGTLGFHILEDQDLFDSFYMTLITLSTVGYEELFELSETGRYFNALLIMAGFGIVFVALGMMTDSLLQLELHNYFNRRRTRRMIDKMSGHYIVCGLGRVGRGVVDWLQRSGVQIMAIDSSASHESWAQEHDVPLLVGDATLDVTLERAGAKRANGLVAATSSDAVNVYITLSARVINPKLRIGARASDEEASKKLIQSGANSVFTPYTFTGFRIAQALLRPQVSTFLDIASAVEHSELDLDIEEYHVTEASRCNGNTIVGSGLTEALDLIVLAVSRPGSSLRFNPPAETPVKQGDVLIVMGRRATLDRMREELGG